MTFAFFAVFATGVIFFEVWHRRINKEIAACDADLAPEDVRAFYANFNLPELRHDMPPRLTQLARAHDARQKFRTSAFYAAIVLAITYFVWIFS